MKWAMGCLFGVIVWTSSAVGSPLILHCEALEVSGMFSDEWRQIDRVVVDEAYSMITFSIARTLGSHNERTFTYRSYKDVFSQDQVAFERVGDSLRIVALRLATPTAIWVEPSSVRLVALNAFGMDQVQLACR